jgi:hypothetical protein
MLMKVQVSETHARWHAPVPSGQKAVSIHTPPTAALLRAGLVRFEKIARRHQVMNYAQDR